MKDFPVRIMHVDDDRGIQLIVKKTLHLTAGVVLKHCSSGQEFIDSFESFEPDLILMDLSMDDMDGLDALEELYKRKQLTLKPVIIITSFTKVTMRDEYKRLGVIGVMHKPIQPGTFPERIRFMWQEYQKSNK